MNAELNATMRQPFWLLENVDQSGIVYTRYPIKATNRQLCHRKYCA